MNSCFQPRWHWQISKFLQSVIGRKKDLMIPHKTSLALIYRTFVSREIDGRVERWENLSPAMKPDCNEHLSHLDWSFSEYKGTNKVNLWHFEHFKKHYVLITSVSREWYCILTNDVLNCLLKPLHAITIMRPHKNRQLTLKALFTELFPPPRLLYHPYCRSMTMYHINLLVQCYFTVKTHIGYYTSLDTFCLSS